jgi:hypothetical protein
MRDEYAVLDLRDDKSSREDAGLNRKPRHSRRLSDKILNAFHQACDNGDIVVAEHLLRLLEMMLSQRPSSPDGTRRRNMECLVAAHERFWHLQHSA